MQCDTTPTYHPKARQARDDNDPVSKEAKLGKPVWETRYPSLWVPEGKGCEGEEKAKKRGTAYVLPSLASKPRVNGWEGTMTCI
jgi:hypothetical protein